MTLPAERRVKKQQIQLLRLEEFAHLSGILMVGSTSVISDEEWYRIAPPGMPPTAATNGRDKFYAKSFVDKISDPALAFVILHEAFHVMGRHTSLYKKLFEKNPMIIGAATDFWINDYLTLLDPENKYIEFPTVDGQKVGLHDTRFRGMSVKQIYDILLQENPQAAGKPGGGQGNIKVKVKMKGSGQGGDEGFDFHDWEGTEGMTEEEKRELEREVDQAIRQGQIAAQKLAGKGSSGIDRAMQELVEPKVDWREVLKEFVRTHCAGKDVSSWRRVNRRFIGSDIYMPSLIGESIKHLVIAPDASGSTWCGNIYRDFMSEVVGALRLVNPEKTDLIFWDTAITNHQEFHLGDYAALESTIQIKGGGGTDLHCVSKWIKKLPQKPDCAIVLTDGYVDQAWGGRDWNGVPVLFVIAGDFKGFAPHGQTIHIGEEV